MSPAQAAVLHAAAFAPERGWTPDEIAKLLESAHVRLIALAGGFALVRTIARETELLTLAVAPAHRRRGIARALLAEWLATAAADTAFLEVAADNAGALRLYGGAGFAMVSRRRGYYRRVDAPAVDALLMQRKLTLGQPLELTALRPKTG